MMRFRFRFRPLVTIAPKVSPDPAQAAELARRRAALSYTPNNGFLVEPPARPRFDAPVPEPVVEATPHPEGELVMITDQAEIARILASDEPLVIPLCTSGGVQAPAQDPTAQPVAPQSPVERTSEVAAPEDWSQFDSPAWERRGRPDPLRSSLELLLPSLLKRQAQ